MSTGSPIESPLLPYEPAPEHRARRALIEAVRKHQETETALLAAIRDCVMSLRSQGMTHEAMVVTMKALVRHTPLPVRDGTAIARPLVERIVEWCILEYYRD